MSLDNRVDFPGRIRNKALGHFYSKAGVIVVTSQ